MNTYIHRREEKSRDFQLKKKLLYIDQVFYNKILLLLYILVLNLKDIEVFFDDQSESIVHIRIQRTTTSINHCIVHMALPS